MAPDRFKNFWKNPQLEPKTQTPTYLWYMSDTPLLDGQRSVALTILMVLAGLMGASGIILAAAGAHAAPGAGLDSASYMLLFHAAAVLGGAALVQQSLLWRPVMLVVLAAWVLGAALFSGDIALRAFAGHRLFVMAAPTGGIILIVAWLGLAAAAVGALMRG
jgi:uncharacterized membrane protein YgdD (TMEM256/DUF423 family)